MSESAITATGLSRSFGANEAVAGVDLDVRRGEVYGFLGPNGAGKSTTVRMLCTLLAPTGGSATVAGLDVGSAADEIRLRIGVALQEAALDLKQTGREILQLQGRLYGLTGSALSNRIDEVVSFVDIGGAIDDLVGTYSGGMKRRVDLASSLLHEPEVLFLDEPTTGLDPASRAAVWAEVQRLNRDLGMTIFLTTQYLEEADQLADRVGIIDAGRLAAEGTPADLKRRIGSDLVVARLTETPDGVLAELRAVEGVTDVAVHDGEVTIAAEDGAAAVGDVVLALDRAGVRARSLTLRTPTLDDVFLSVTGHRIEPGTARSTDPAGDPS